MSDERAAEQGARTRRAFTTMSDRVGQLMPECRRQDGEPSELVVSTAMVLQWLHGPGNVTPSMVRERVRLRYPWLHAELFADVPVVESAQED